MDKATLYELIGYFASALVVTALTMTSYRKLRIFSLLGSVTFGIYGLLIGSVPIILTNIAIMAINTFYLWKAATDHSYYSILEVEPDSDYANRFLEFHKQSIKESQPDFDGSLKDADFICFILRDMVPAGLVVGRECEPGVLTIVLDYATPEFRDNRLGQHFFGPSRQSLVEKGYRTVRTTALTKAHEAYVERMGFKKVGDVYERSLV
ncbi:hypothetical protein MNBD_ACTINO02-2280 [hydrothermal vent metagenome]|uniref:N-acetyltransferase domain-containing protein n=1 Tax=hydrothermal vent metagenome TaxID=652676 RepID=A0A3B0S347_9ZZZZ